MAKVNGQEITDDDVKVALDDLGPNLPAQLKGPQRDAYALDYLIDLKLVAGQAAKDKLGDSPDFARKMAYLHDKTLMETMLGNVAKASATDEAEHKVYDDAAKARKPEQEIHARHILVPTEDEAKAALDRVKKGEDFAKVADEVSKDPGSQGGDLGWFTARQDGEGVRRRGLQARRRAGLGPGQVRVRLARHQGGGQAREGLPALRSGEGSGRQIRGAEVAERSHHEAA